MEGPGRPTDLTEELTLQIRKLVLDSLSYKEIQEVLEIPSGTWDAWVHKNYKDFRANLIDWKRERMIKKAEAVVEVSMESENEKIALDAAEFTLETLGKKEYSKRSETDITSGGKPIVHIDATIAENNGIAPDPEANS